MFFLKHKTAYEMCISDWSSDVCSSDLNILPIARTDSYDATTQDEEGQASWVPDTPSARLGSPDEDIAPVALFLASKDSQFLTGYSLTPDGGYVIDSAR